ncbi:MAG: hypothetical protein ACREL3_03675 [Gemmatimonadales bacterium]
MAEGAAGAMRPHWRSYLEFDRRTAVGLGVTWVAELAFAQLAGRGHVGIPRPGMIVQSAGCLVLFGLLFSFVPVRSWASRLPRPHQIAIGVVFFLIVAGQLATVSRHTFPFPAWTMYGKAESPPRLEYYRYRGIDALGKEVSVDPAQVLGFVNVAEIASHVRAIARAARLAPDDPAREPGRAKLHDLLQTIARAYDLKHPGAPLRSLQFLWYSWDYHKVPADSVVPEPLLTIDLSDGAAK